MKSSNQKENTHATIVVNTLPSSIPGNITIGSVQKLLELTREKEKLDREASEVLGRRDAVEKQMAEILGTRVGVAVAKAGRAARGPRGAIKGAIIQALRTVGAEGMATQRIADVTQIPRRDVERYIYSKSGKTAGIERVDTGIYRLASAVTQQPAGTKKRG